MTGPNGAEAWIALAFALVLFAALGPGPASLVRYSLLAVIFYLAITHAGRFAPAIARFNRSLPVAAAGPSAARPGAILA